MFCKCKAESIMKYFDPGGLNPPEGPACGIDRKAEESPVFVDDFNLCDRRMLNNFHFDEATFMC